MQAGTDALKWFTPAINYIIIQKAKFLLQPIRFPSSSAAVYFFRCAILLAKKQRHGMSETQLVNIRFQVIQSALLIPQSEVTLTFELKGSLNHPRNVTIAELPGLELVVCQNSVTLKLHLIPSHPKKTTFNHFCSGWIGGFSSTLSLGSP